MSFVPGRRSHAGSSGTDAGTSGADHQGVPGKRTLTEGLVVQRKATGSPDAAPDPGAAVAAAATSTGVAPDPAMRARVEQVTGADLSGVRVHTGAPSHTAAQALSARAFTVGQDVHFASGEYRPGSSDGNRLLAHELAHTVQQGSSTSGPQCKLEVSQPGDAAEGEADAVATAATGAGGPVAVTQHRGVMLQREAIAGNKFGHWDLTQVNTNGANSSAIYASEVNIAFKPEAATADATEIAFVQNVQILDSGNQSFENRDNFKNRMTDDGSTIDRVADRKYGYYGYNNDGNASATTKPGTTATKPPTPATMYDKPSFNKPETKWSFEAAATAKTGADAGTIYGALQWGFDVDKDNKLTSHKAKHLDKQTAGFDKAVAKWNEQAKGDESKRNHKDQVELGPFKSKT